MVSTIEIPKLTPEQEREIDRDVDQGAGNYGQMIARVTGVDVFKVPQKQNMSRHAPTSSGSVPKWRADNWRDLGESSKRKPSPYGTAE